MLARRNRELPPRKPEAASFAAKATDLQALRDAVVDAASVGTGLWLSYLFVLFYFAIAAGAVDASRSVARKPGQTAVSQCRIATQGLLYSSGRWSF